MPICVFDYIIGHIILNKFLHLKPKNYNPEWFNSLTDKIGYRLSVWEFIVGGTIFSIIIGFLSYFIIKRVLEKILKKKRIYETYSAK